MVAPLVTRCGRPAAWAVLGVAVAVVVVLSVLLHDTTTNRFDAKIITELYVHIGHPRLVEALLWPSEPAVDVVVAAAVAAVALWRRAWTVAALAALGPVVASGLTELVLKPVVRRRPAGEHNPDGLAFPSGHETGLSPS
jgi:hypothetical protein